MQIRFTPLTAADLPMLRAWMGSPHWSEWWGKVDDELAHIVDKIEGRDATRPFLFHIDGQPIGYIQYWFVEDNLFEPFLSRDPWLEFLPKDAVGIDLSIGEEKNLSKGYGSATLRQFALERKAEGHETILIDPDPKNLRAIRAYRKAGFKSITKLDGKNPATHFNIHLMEFAG